MGGLIDTPLLVLPLGVSLYRSAPVSSPGQFWCNSDNLQTRALEAWQRRYQIVDTARVIARMLHTNRNKRVDRGDDPASKQQRRALAVLGEMIATNGVPLPAGCPSGPMGVKLETWRLHLVDKTIIESRSGKFLSL